MRRPSGMQVLICSLVVANALVIYGEWRQTEAGCAFRARMHAKLSECSGCARRRARLAAMVRRVHAEAEHIVAGTDP